jgi:hypothetical protein
MKRREWIWFPFGTAILGSIIYAGILVSRGFSTASEPSSIEKFVARTARNFAIPRKSRREANPWKSTSDFLKEAWDSFIARGAICHGSDGSGETDFGLDLYPKVPDLRSPQTQNLTDGEIRYIIRNGVRLTGMPGWTRPHNEQSDDSWKLFLFVRSLRQLTTEEQQQQATTTTPAHFVGSQGPKFLKKKFKNNRLATCKKTEGELHETQTIVASRANRYSRGFLTVG